MAILSNAERLEVIKDKLNDFQTTIWDLTEDDYMFLYKQAEQVEILVSTITVLDNDFQKDIMNKERIAYGYKKQRDSLKEENARLREALTFYANVDNYETWHNAYSLTDYIHNVDFDNGCKARKSLEETK